MMTLQQVVASVLAGQDDQDIENGIFDQFVAAGLSEREASREAANLLTRAHVEVFGIGGPAAVYV